MKKESLARLVEQLEGAINTLRSDGIDDERIMSRYVEYRVAFELSNRGHTVQVLSERGDKGADIYLPADKLRIEVKSGKFVYGSSCASFGMGKQIKEGKFDYCVFVPYDETNLREFLVFSRDELAEVADRQLRSFARYPKTNPCMIVRYDSYEEYKESLERFGEKTLKVEEELHKHPEKFKDNWEKIKRK